MKCFLCPVKTLIQSLKMWTGCCCWSGRKADGEADEPPGSLTSLPSCSSLNALQNNEIRNEIRSLGLTDVGPVTESMRRPMLMRLYKLRLGRLRHSAENFEFEKFERWIELDRLLSCQMATRNSGMTASSSSHANAEESIPKTATISALARSAKSVPKKASISALARAEKSIPKTAPSSSPASAAKSVAKATPSSSPANAENSIPDPKEYFIYFLIDPRNLSQNDDHSVPDNWLSFLNSIFYVGKGWGSRPFQHLKEAKELSEDIGEDVGQTSEKTGRILNIWQSGGGVIIHEICKCSSNDEALSRESAIIEAIGLKKLTNFNKGSFLGDSSINKSKLGTALLYQSYRRFQFNLEVQLRQNDVRSRI